MGAVELLLAGVMMVLVPVGLWYAVVGTRRRDRRKQWVGLACLGLSLFLWWRMSHADFWLVDRCLDAGGRYNDQERMCEFE